MQNNASNGSVAALRLENRIDQLDYIRAMIHELRIMSAAERCDMIALHLEMAYIEASDQLRELQSLEKSFERRAVTGEQLAEGK